VTSTAPGWHATWWTWTPATCSALVRVRVPGGTVRERAFDRDVLLNQSKVIGCLAPMGATCRVPNCKDVIRYLTDCEKRLGRRRPRVESVTHLGWADGPLGAFMPYDAGEGAVRFDPLPTRR
jgi:hypothetical protein